MRAGSLFLQTWRLSVEQKPKSEVCELKENTDALRGWGRNEFQLSSEATSVHFVYWSLFVSAAVLIDLKQRVFHFVPFK